MEKYTFNFNSLAELCEYAEEKITNYKTATNKHNLSSFKLERLCTEELREGFYGVTSFDDAVKIRKEGYKIIADNIKISDNASPNNTRPRNILSVAGGAPCVPNAIQGRPLCMYRRTKIQTPAKNINVYVNVAVASSVTAQQIADTMKKIFAFVQSAREDARVRVIACCSAVSDKAKYSFFASAPIFDSEKCHNIESISYVFHPSFLRVHVFGLIGSVNKWNDAHLGNVANISNNPQSIGAQSGDYCIDLQSAVKDNKFDMQNYIVK